MNTSIKFMLVALMGCLVISCSKPEDELTSRMEEIGEIMEDNMETPEAGLTELIAYGETHGAKTSRLFLELTIELVNIEDGSDRKDRMKEVHKTLSREFKNLEGIAEKFGKRVDKDEQAQERMNEFTEKWSDLQSLGLSKAFTVNSNRTTCEINQSSLTKGKDAMENINNYKVTSMRQLVGRDGPFDGRSPVCPSGGKYHLSNGQISCDHSGH